MTGMHLIPVAFIPSAHIAPPSPFSILSYLLFLTFDLLILTFDLSIVTTPAVGSVRLFLLHIPLVLIYGIPP